MPNSLKAKEKPKKHHQPSPLDTMQGGIYIGLGSNLDEPVQQVLTAIKHLQSATEIHVVAVSNLYKTPPMGPQDQPDYINAVVELKTALPPYQLLRFLQQLENQQARSRETERWSARTLDLDLLLYADTTLNTDELTIPHIGIKHRAFVLYPLYDIVHNKSLPVIGQLDNLIKQLNEPQPEIINTNKLDV
jgi:2-amino-4-hydroxy-6-hydroxymethyldihydropteridine diphosphokinase